MARAEGDLWAPAGQGGDEYDRVFAIFTPVADDYSDSAACDPGAGCLPSGEQSMSGPAVVNASPKVTASLADSTSAPVTAAPTFTTTQSPVVSPVELPAEMATAAPTADLPIAPVMGARAPGFTLTDLNGDDMSPSELRGQPVLLNFWATW